MLRRSYAAALAVFALVYYGTAVLGSYLLDFGFTINPIWLPSGIALAVILLFGYRLWPGITAAVFVFSLQNLISTEASLLMVVLAAALIACAKTGEAVIGVYLLRRLAGEISPVSKARDYLKYVFLAAFVTTAVSTSAIESVLNVTGIEPRSEVGILWLYRWAGTQASILIIGPLILAWHAEPRLSRRILPSVEAVFSLLVIGVSLQVILLRSTSGGSDPSPPPEVALLIPMFIASLIWAAIRLGPRGVTSAIFVTWMIALGNTVAGVGSMVLDTPAESFLMVQASWTSVALVIMIPAAAIAEGKEFARMLQKTTKQLQIKAGDLSVANTELEQAISERRFAEEKERRQKKNYEALLNAQSELGQGLTLFDLDTQRLLYANEAFCRMSGYSEDELLDLFSIFVLVPAETKESISAQLTARRTGREAASHIETSMLRKDGSTLEIETSIQPLNVDGGRQLIAITRDIGERKLAEEAIRQSEEKYRSLFEESKDVICTMDADGRILDINPAGLELFGYSSRSEMREIDPSTAYFQNSEDQSSFFQELRRHGFVKEYELILKARDGKELVLDITANAVSDAGGEIASVRGIMHDVSEHRRLEQQLIQSQKMESIGRLAGGVAHDLNNFLTGVMGYIDLAARETKSGERIWEELQGARMATDHAADLTRQLLLFSRREVPALRPVDLNRTVEGLIKMLGRVIGENYPIRKEIYNGVATVNADPGHLEQVLMNLVVNARDAMPEGGEIVISTGKFRLDESHDRCVSGMRPGEYARLSVIDQGTGLDPETMQHIFEPFFTTKGLGKGTGLGLSVVFGIVTQHGGWVEVDSEPGKGSTFSVCLPARFTVPQTESQDSLPLDLIQGRGEKILVIEDDSMVRNLAMRMLSENGYEVFTAADGTAAERVFDKHSQEIRLIFSDVVLPGEDGIRLVQRLQKKQPGIKVLFASGYSNEEQLFTIRQSKDSFIPKPYVLPQLLKTLREML